jgi:hypothetical protein
MDVNWALDDNNVSLEDAALWSEAVTSSGVVEELPVAPHRQDPPVPAADPVALPLQSQLVGLE